MFTKDHTTPDPKPERARNYKGYATSEKGYLLVYKPSHPNASGNYVQEHRLVMEYYLGRYLEPHEIVHHIDHNKRNNVIQNLQIVSMAEHRRLHNITDKTGTKKYNLEQVELLYKTGYSMRDIANELEMGKSTVAVYVKELGISRPRLQNRDPLTNQFIRRGQKTLLPKRNGKGQFKGG